MTCKIKKNFFYQCKKFVYNHEFEQTFRKNDVALFEYVVLDSDVCLYEIVNEYIQFIPIRSVKF